MLVGRLFRAFGDTFANKTLSVPETGFGVKSRESEFLFLLEGEQRRQPFGNPGRETKITILSHLLIPSALGLSDKANKPSKLVVIYLF